MLLNAIEKTIHLCVTEVSYKQVAPIYSGLAQLSEQLLPTIEVRAVQIQSKAIFLDYLFIAN